MIGNNARDDVRRQTARAGIRMSCSGARRNWVRDAYLYLPAAPSVWLKCDVVEWFNKVDAVGLLRF